jgi:AraC-like DNA-binding protein/quercetin dioxygenase-like cupin family protein
MNLTDTSIPIYNIIACSGGTDFAIRRFELDEKISAWSVPHRHEGYSISLLIKGSVIKYVDFEKHNVQAPAIFSVGPEQVHQFVSATDAEMITISFTKEFLIAEMQGWLSCWECMFGHVVLSIDEESMQELMVYTDLLQKEFSEERTKKELVIRNVLNAFIVSCARIRSSNVTIMHMDLAQNKLVRQFKHHVDSNFREKTMVAEYAEMLFVTPGHLNDVIKTIVGKTAKQIIDEKRLMEAKRLLFWGNNSIKEIAWELNFDDDAYFNRFFKKHTGHTPFLFQRIIREKYN